jgi:hypothetical protein
MAFICNNQPTQLKVLEQFIINIRGAGKDKFFDSSENDIMEGNQLI